MTALLLAFSVTASPFVALSGLVLPTLSQVRLDGGSQLNRVAHSIWLGALTTGLGVVALTLVGQLESSDEAGKLLHAVQWKLSLGALPFAAVLGAAATVLAVITVPTRLRA